MLILARSLALNIDMPLLFIEWFLLFIKTKRSELILDYHLYCWLI